MVITGASSGIGLETARKAARAGVKVVLVARNKSALRAIVEDINEGDGQAAYDAAAMHAKLYRFAVGEIRVIRFMKGVRTPPMVNPIDTLIYTVSGRRVWFVNDQARESVPGDSEFHPKGVEHHAEALEEGIGMEFVFASGDADPAARGVWKPGKDQPLSDAGPAKLRLFDYGALSIRELSLAKGAGAIQDANAGGRLLFVLSGTLALTAGDRAYALRAHDAASLTPGEAVTIEATDDCVWLEAPFPA